MIKEEIKDAMREFKNHILGEIQSIQKSIEDLDASVKENKDEIKSLMDRTQALETQYTLKDNKIKELTDKINDTQQHQRNFSIHIKGLHVPKEYNDMQQHQRNFSIRIKGLHAPKEYKDTQQHQRNFSIHIKGLHVPKEYKDIEFLKYVYNKGIQLTLEFAKLKGELSQAPEYDKVIEQGHILPSCSSPTVSRHSQTSPSLIHTFSIKTYSSQGYQAQLPCFKSS